MSTCVLIIKSYVRLITNKEMEKHVKQVNLFKIANV